MTTATATPKPAAPSQDARFIPVHIDSLDASMLEMDVWVQFPGQRSPTLYRGTGLAVRLSELQRLRDQNINFVYIPTQQHAAYRKQLQAKLDRTFKDTTMAKQERTRIIRANCAKMIEDVLLLPGRSEPLDTIVDVSRAFTTWSTEHPGEFSYVLDMSAHDFYTSTHMVNVGVGCALLVKQLRPGDAETAAIAVQGGLLHDIGKREIPEALLNKEGKLTDDEYGIIKTHPMRGFEELSKQEKVQPIILEMTRDHHERLDGKGYPNGKKGDEIGFFARVCAVVDVFDALTAARPYRGPMHPADAMKIMTEGVGTQFDPEIFAAWKELVNDLVNTDPARASGTKPGSTAIPLAKLMPRPTTIAEPTPAAHAAGTNVPARTATAGISTLSPSERRRHLRRDCEIPITIVFTQQNRELPVMVGEPITVMMVDISRGGIGVATPFAFAKGDQVRLEIPSPTGKPLERGARVVSVRRENDHWRVGLQFFDTP